MINSVETLIDSIVDDEKNSQDGDTIDEQVVLFSKFIKKISDEIKRVDNIIYDDDIDKLTKEIHVIYMYGLFNKFLKLTHLRPTEINNLKIKLVSDIIDNLALEFNIMYVLLEDGLESFQNAVDRVNLPKDYKLKRFMVAMKSNMIAIGYRNIVQKLIDVVNDDDTSLPNLIFNRIKREVGLNRPNIQTIHPSGHKLFNKYVHHNVKEKQRRMREIQEQEIDDYLDYIENNLIGDSRMKEFYSIMIYVLQLEIKFIGRYRLYQQHSRFELYIDLKKVFIKRLLVIHPRLAFLIFVRDINTLDRTIKENVLVIQGYEHIRLDKDEMFDLYRDFNRLSKGTIAEIYRINENDDGTFDLVFSEQKEYIKKIYLDEINPLIQEQKKIKKDLEHFEEERSRYNSYINEKYGEDLNKGKVHRENLIKIDEHIDKLQTDLEKITPVIEQKKEEQLQKPQQMFTRTEEEEFQTIQEELDRERKELWRQEFEDENS